MGMYVSTGRKPPRERHTVNAQIAGRFIEDWQPAAEQLMQEADDGIADRAYIELINKIDDAPRKKSGKGYNINIELEPHEIELLRAEALYRMEFWSLIYQDCKADIDQTSHKAAKKLYLELGGVITEAMADKMGVAI